MSFKPIDAKRDEFRKYLERTGVLEAISKVFIKLIHCPDRPENAIDFICANLGSTLHKNDQIENLQKDLEESKDEIAQLKQIIENLKSEKKVAVINEQSFQQHQETIEEFNKESSLSDDVNNIQKQMENTTFADTSYNLSETVVPKEPSLNTSNDDSAEDISPIVNEKNTEINDELTSDAIAADKVTDADLSKKNDETVE